MPTHWHSRQSLFHKKCFFLKMQMEVTFFFFFSLLSFHHSWSLTLVSIIIGHTMTKNESEVLTSLLKGWLGRVEEKCLLINSYNSCLRIRLVIIKCTHLAWTDRVKPTPSPTSVAFTELQCSAPEPFVHKPCQDLEKLKIRVDVNTITTHQFYKIIYDKFK